MNEIKIEKRLGLAPLVHKKEVAAYCRVSVEKDAMLHSLSAQISYYQDYIGRNNEWLYVGTYADEGISGTKENRPEFKRMIEDCRAHKIDMIITKSISRFARNTTYLLETTRLLKELKIDVYFEEQKIHTLSCEGELMLTLLAGFAEEEAKSVRDNCYWRIKKNFENGNSWGGIKPCLGYDIIDGEPIVNDKEAKIVKEIFALAYQGIGPYAIASILNKKGYKTKTNKSFSTLGISNILSNEFYLGTLILQASYRNDKGQKRINRGQKDKFLLKNHHYAIIDIEIFNKCKEFQKQRNAKYGNTIVKTQNVNSPFRGIVYCGHCGCIYQRKKNHGKYAFYCNNAIGRTSLNKCKNKQVPEWALYDCSCKELKLTEFNEVKFKKHIKRINVIEKGVLEFEFYDGHKSIEKWEYPPRSESWTAEMKELARERSLNQYAKSRENICNN